MSENDHRETVRLGYERVADTYFDRLRNPVEGTDRAAQINRYTNLIAELVPAGATALDLGCGAGVPFTRFLTERYETIGVDFSERQLEMARANAPKAKFVQADMTLVEFQLDSFDLVTAFFSIIHVPHAEQPALLSRIAGWLRPNGVFVATFDWQDREWTDENDDWLGAPMYWSSMGRTRVRDVLSQCHLTIERDVTETVENGVDGPEASCWIIARKSANA